MRPFCRAWPGEKESGWWRISSLKHKATKERMMAAMGMFAVLSAMAGFTLDGVLRIAVLILMVALAAKTWIAYKAGW